MKRFILTILLLACSASADPTTVTLRSTARFQPGQDVLLSDVAVADGPLAESISATVVLDADDLLRRASRGWLRLSVQDIAQSLDLPASDVLFRGSVCNVAVLAPPPTIITSHPDRAARVQIASGPTVLDLVTARLAREFGVVSADLQLTFDDRYAQTLRTPVADCTADVQPTGLSDNMPVAVTLYDADRIVLSSTVRLRVELRRSVAVADRLIPRRATLEATQYHFEDQWLPLSTTPATPDQLDGAEARMALEPGSIIETRHVEPPIVVRRGDMVAVRVISGSIVAKITARALSDGRDGQRVQFEPLNGGDRFSARMNGPGRAVLNRSTEPAEAD